MRFVVRAMGWTVVEISPDGSETTVEVWSKKKAKKRAAVLDKKAKRGHEKQRLK